MKRAFALACLATVPAVANAQQSSTPTFVASERWTGVYIGAGVGVGFGGTSPHLLYGQGAPGFANNVFRGPGYYRALDTFANALAPCVTPDSCAIVAPTRYLASPNLGWPGGSGSRNTDFAATLAAGYNKQWGNLVLGFEFDVSFLNNRVRSNWSGTGEGTFSVEVLGTPVPASSDVMTMAVAPPTVPPGTLTEGAYTLSTSLNAVNKTEWVSTLRARAGFATGPVFLYGTGGFALGGMKMGVSGSTVENVTVTTTPPGGGVPQSVTTNVRTVTTWSGQRDSSTALGWALGAGAEWAFDDNWSLKGEYVYYNLGAKGVTARGVSTTTGDGVTTPIVTTATPITLRHRFDGNLARVGVNYRFGGPVASVVASY